MEQYDPRVDAFIGKSAPFAQPILQHIRALIHETSPLITETIKWSCPFFDYKGTLCHMNAFKAHVGFGFWDSRALTDPGNYLKRGDEKDAVGNFGRITTLADLPPDHILQEFIRQANEENVGVAAGGGHIALHHELEEAALTMKKGGQAIIVTAVARERSQITVEHQGKEGC